MESSDFNTSSIRNKWDCRMSLTTSERRNFSSRQDWMKGVARFYGMLLLSAKCPRPPGRRENSIWKKIWWIIQRAYHTSRCTSGIPSNISKRSSKNSSIWSESTTRDFSGICIDRGVNLERRYSNADIEESEILDASEIYRRRLNAKEVLITSKKWRICISCGAWFSKIVGKRQRIPGNHSETWTNRKERGSQRRFSWRSGRVSAEQEDETTVRKDFWSMQGDFVYRHHIEPRVQLHVPTERTFPIPLKYLDVTRSTFTDLDLAQENEFMIVGTSMETTIFGFVDRFHEVYSIERGTSQRIHVIRGGRLTKNQTTSRPDHMCPEAWTRIGKAAQRKEKQEWALEKPSHVKERFPKPVLHFWWVPGLKVCALGNHCKKIRQEIRCWTLKRRLRRQVQNWSRTSWTRTLILQSGNHCC